MATALDKIAGPIAKKLIAQFGGTITYTRVVDGAYNPSDSSSATTESSYTIKALVEDYALVDSGAGFAAGLIVFGDKKITFAALSLSFEPSPGDKVTYGGDVYTIVRVLKTYSGEQVALFEVQGRK